MRTPRYHEVDQAMVLAADGDGNSFETTYIRAFDKLSDDHKTVIAENLSDWGHMGDQFDAHVLAWYRSVRWWV